MKQAEICIDNQIFDNLTVGVQDIFDIGLRVYQLFCQKQNAPVMDSKMEQIHGQLNQLSMQMQQQQQWCLQTEMKHQDMVDQLCKFSKISQKRGELGEQQIQYILEKGFPDCRINEVSSLAHSGDFELCNNDFCILFEIKNYTHSVPTTEIEKFKRDIFKSTCDGFIFVAINTRIANKPLFQLENYNGKPVIYISEFAIDNHAQLISAVLFLRDMIGGFKQQCQKQQLKCKNIIIQQKAGLVKILNSLEKEIIKIKKEISQCEEKLLQI